MSLEYTNINIPAFAACDADRTHVYLLLVFKGMPDWTEQDYLDWEYATGRKLRRVTATPLTVKWGVL